MYSLVMYFVPLGIAKWQQHREDLQHITVMGQGSVVSKPTSKLLTRDEGAIAGVSTSPTAKGIPGTCTSSGGGSSSKPPAAGTAPKHEQEKVVGRAVNGARVKQEQEAPHSTDVPQQLQAAPNLPTQEQRREEQQQQEADLLPVTGALAPGSTLYTSPLQHRTLSLKVGTTEV
jgi:hypothetical protein